MLWKLAYVFLNEKHVNRSFLAFKERIKKATCYWKCSELDVSELKAANSRVYVDGQALHTTFFSQIFKRKTAQFTSLLKNKVGDFTLLSRLKTFKFT
jgi:hypothetical protein